MKTSRIVVVGSINMDLVTRTDNIPIPGETVIGGDLQIIPGGKGANQAVAAARLGADVDMVGHVGNDVFAKQLKENLDADGVNQTYVTGVEAASGVALIVVDASGQNSIVVAPGANGWLTPSDVEAAVDVIKSADVMLLQLEVPLETVFRAAQLAHESGVRVILNPAPAQPLPAELLQLVDVLVPNESEAAVLTGLAVDDEEGLKPAATMLQSLGVAIVILTLGSRGALLAQDGKFTHFPPFTVADVVDTTAAGDAFVGGLATAIAGGAPVGTAIPWGNAAGALAITRAGAQPSLPTRQKVVALLSQATANQMEGISL